MSSTVVSRTHSSTASVSKTRFHIRAVPRPREREEYLLYEESDKERISLLSTQIGELAQMLAISRVSKCNHGHSPWEKLGGLRWI